MEVVDGVRQLGMAAFDRLVPLIVTIVGVRCACGRLTAVSVLALAPGN